ncbi:MlaE family lipid ABC transporter permease subunit [Niveispirillum sp. SYP-B3756]|uniref:MlaE family lipid ABC transporter permease subunit n=1 Tax=Niveispirillum sp. SYP-B3756 TaxID=2662178 RepID=UPI0020003E84|nr:MlaE family lipid ABC transporter permease subunit [Niveispirillum sp. SYP-B3756]
MMPRGSTRRREGYVQRGTITSAWAEGQFILTAAGRWDIASAQVLETQLRAKAPDRQEASVCLDLSGLTALDTAGALVIDRLLRRLRNQGHQVAVVGARADLCELLREVQRASQGIATPMPLPAGPRFPFVDRIGRVTVAVGQDALAMLNFLGLVTVTLLRLLRAPGRFRWKPFAFHLEQVGLNALPIVGLLSFLIGIVLAYQGADQLRRFGAEIYVVNLLGIGVLREIGILMTSIIVAGRSGSAFTAQIGTMKVNQEVDAMRTLGLDPMELLVLPRMLALLVALPLVAFFANVVALAGGAVMAYAYLDINFVQFTRQLQIAVSATTLFVGLVKAPVFAVVIALVGCYEGLRVTGSAESVGLLTTKSVVVSIFLVIVLDAIFSILFSYLGI